MRITLNLDDEILEAIKTYAQSNSLNLGQAVSELLRRTIPPSTPTRVVNGFVVFQLPTGSPKVKRKTVNKLRDDL